MNCPHCDVNLLMSERQGVEIDYCPQCRGVWLDRGELDKIVDRSHAELVATLEGAPPVVAAPGGLRDDRDRSRDEERRRDDRHRRDQPTDARKKKRTSFLEDIFDF